MDGGTLSEILRPEAMEAEMRLLIGELAKLMFTYRVAHGVAFSPQVVETANVTAEHSNVPHSMVDQNSKLRGELRAACEMIRRFRTGVKKPDGTVIRPGLEQQVDWLKSAFEASEHRHGIRFDPVRNPRSLAADGSEHAELLEAQRRRRERGETA